MKNKLDLTVIIPVHQLDEVTETLLTEAVQSVKDQTLDPKQVMFVAASEDISTQLKSMFDKKYQYVVNDSGKTDYCSQVNFGVAKSKTSLFSILEFDDVYTPYYFEVANTYMSSAEYANFSAFLPTILLVKDGKSLQCTNNAVWAQDFSSALGVLDFNSTKEFDVFMLSGGIINKEAFLSVGGLKGDIKLFFAKEFLLRFINGNYSVMSIPKIGYKHVIGREGALFQQYQADGMTPEEAKFYMDAAKKEYLYNPDEIKREITYSSNEVV